MRRSLWLVSILVAALAWVPAPAFAFTADEVAGDYYLMFNAKLKVSGAFSDADVTYGIGGMGPSVWEPTAGLFTVLEYDPPRARLYSGWFQMDLKGKKVLYDISPQGEAELKDVMATWIVNVAASGGLSVTVTNISFDSLTIKPAKVSKSTGLPIKTTLKARGWVSGTVDGTPVVKKLKYSSKVTFLGELQ